MAKKTKSKKVGIHKRIKSKVAGMSFRTKLITSALGTILVGVAVFLAIGSSYAASPHNDVPITDTADARVSNLVVETQDNTIRIQFDYELANGATEATVDAALVDQRSFNQVTFTEPGRYDETLTEIPDGSYYVSVMISGNPSYLLGDPGPSNQPLVVTFPDSESKKVNGTKTVREIRQYYHQQNRKF